MRCWQPPEPGQEGWGPGPRCASCERRATFAGEPNTPSAAVSTGDSPPSQLNGGGEDAAVTDSTFTTSCPPTPPPGPAAGEPPPPPLRAGSIRQERGESSRPIGVAVAGSAAASVTVAAPIRASLRLERNDASRVVVPAAASGMGSAAATAAAASRKDELAGLLRGLAESYVW